MEIANEDDILELEFRKKVITEIKDTPNEHRKLTELRKHEIYRDLNRKWVMHALLHEGFKTETLSRMENRASNISICRKIINKLAQTYIGGVQRRVEDKNSQGSIDALTRELDINTKLKKSDRYRQLFKNTVVQIVGRPNTIETKASGESKFEIALKVLAPWEYDVIEDTFDNTQPLVFILTDFPERNDVTFDTLRGSQGRRPFSTIDFHEGDRREQTIADEPSDKGTEKRTFIWWSAKWHFTTDETGAIIKMPKPEAPTLEQQIANPIEKLPFMDIHSDQDGNYWATGGTDVIEGSILVNKEITDLNFIKFLQGWGQLVISAKDVPKVLEGGPDNAFVFDVREGDPTPQVFYASSNPNLTAWMDTIKSQVALLLSTNDLSTKMISATLDGVDPASGIALLIENAEVTANQQDVQNLYRDKEPILWEIIRRWHRLFSETNSLTEDLQAIPVFEDSDVKLKFNQLKPVVSELEQLNVLEKRKALGLDTIAELLQRDNPDLSLEDAQKRVLELLEEKKMSQQTFMNNIPRKEEPNGETQEESKAQEKAKEEEEE